MERQRRLGIIVERDPPYQNIRIYYLKVGLEPPEEDCRFFTSKRIHEALTANMLKIGDSIGHFSLYQDTRDDRPIVRYDDAKPFIAFNEPPKKTGISSQAEQRILEDLVRLGLGSHGIEHDISTGSDFREIMSDLRTGQLCKRFGIPGKPDSLNTRQRIKEELEKHTVASYLDLLRRYIESHKTD